MPDTYRKTAIVILISAGIAFLSCSCLGGRMEISEKISDASEQTLRTGIERMKGLSIFFGHQSVGSNLIQGIREISDTYKISEPNFIDQRTSPTQELPAFFHSGIGSNGDPLGKIADFDSILRSGMAQKVDIACMKLCYADITPYTDVELVFNAYFRTIASLKRDFPKVRFIHLTAPLVAPKTSIKEFLKTATGQPINSREGNIKRELYNAKIRKEFEGVDTVFDLALTESVSTTGTRTKLSHNGIDYYTLRPEYTEDGGHLNEIGRKFASAQFIVSLIKPFTTPEQK